MRLKSWRAMFSRLSRAPVVLAGDQQAMLTEVVVLRAELLPGTEVPQAAVLVSVPALQRAVSAAPFGLGLLFKARMQARVREGAETQAVQGRPILQTSGESLAKEKSQKARQEEEGESRRATPSTIGRVVSNRTDGSPGQKPRPGYSFCRL